MEDNEENLIIDENVENIESTEELQEENIIPYAYYDNYYEEVLKSLTSIEENQQTIIYNQEQILLKDTEIGASLHVVCFLLGLSFAYTFIRSILH